MAMEESATAGAGGDLSRALAFVLDAFGAWRDRGLIGGPEHGRIQSYYQELQRGESPRGGPPGALTLPAVGDCWNCKRRVGANDYCPECGAPTSGEEVDRLRYLVCLCHEIKSHERAGRLELSAAHGCLADANGRIAALRRKLNGRRLLSVLPTDDAPASAPPSEAGAVAPSAPNQPSPPAAPRRNLLEILLDPRSIQWLLASGAAVLVIGLIIWLAASGLFENKVFVAVLLGAGNALLLAGGWAVIRFTRYQLAGRALTLLACLLMPLNLWFYNYQDLITVKDGHLWLAAVVCCALYAVSARLLRDRAFVYVLVGGVALTGLLMLADVRLLHDDLFWQISAPATFLVCLGLACIHAERAFPEGEGPFSRRRFGLAFFWSGHVALGVGLLLILGAQVTGDLFRDLFHSLFAYPLPGGLKLEQPSGVLEASGRLLALGLIAAATYAYAYSDLVVRRVGVYIHLAVACFLWAELSLLRWMDGPPEAFLIALALTGLLANFALTALLPPTSTLRRTGPALALGLCGLPLLIGLMMHFEAVAPFAAHYTPNWWYVAALALTAVACRVGAFLHRADRPWLANTYLFGTAGALLLGAAGLLMTLNPGMEWRQQAPILMLIPLAYLVAARLYRGGALETPVVWAAHAGTAVLIVSCLGAAFQGFVLQRDPSLNLLLAAFFAEAALFYLLAAVWRDREFAVYACAVAAAASVWQLLVFADVRADEYYVGAFAVLGLLLLVAYRFAALEKTPTAGLGRAAFQAGNALLSLAAVAGALLAVSDLAGREQFSFGLLVALQAVLAGACLAALLLVRQPGWRRWYLLAAVAEGGLTALVSFQRMRLSGWQKLELVCLVIGLGLLVAGHIGWRREREQESDLVSFGLFLGSLFVAVPLSYAVVYYRFTSDAFDAFRTFNEVGMLVAGLLLLGGGIVLHIKSTTINGAVVMALYVLSLVAFVRLPDVLKTTAVYLMIGGGAFFGVGLLLSIYRDRLLALPQRIQRRDGVFRVLNWR